MNATITVPESARCLPDILNALQRHPALAPLSVGLMLELPCCGIRVDAEGIHCAKEPSTVYWPPRWLCDQCHRVWSVGDFDPSRLVEVACLCPTCDGAAPSLAQPATRAAATGRVPDSHHEPSGDRANAAGETSEDAR